MKTDLVFFAKENEADQSFSVTTDSVVKPGSNKYTHWAEGLTVMIQKNGATMQLTGAEVKQIIDLLPRTVGGKY